MPRRSRISPCPGSVRTTSPPRRPPAPRSSGIGRTFISAPISTTPTSMLMSPNTTARSGTTTSSRSSSSLPPRSRPTTNCRSTPRTRSSTVSSRVAAAWAGSRRCTTSASSRPCRSAARSKTGPTLTRAGRSRCESRGRASCTRAGGPSRAPSGGLPSAATITTSAASSRSFPRRPRSRSSAFTGTKTMRRCGSSGQRHRPQNPMAFRRSCRCRRRRSWARRSPRCPTPSRGRYPRRSCRARSPWPISPAATGCSM